MKRSSPLTSRLLPSLIAAAVWHGMPARAQTPAPAAPPAAVPTAKASTNKIGLTPQNVVDLALARGRSARAAEFAAQRSYLAVETARSVYDLRLASQLNWQVDEAESLSGFSNERDETTVFGLSLTKPFSTGTSMTLAYNLNRQNSVLSPFTTQTRNPQANLRSLSASVRQSLLRNYFGYADRLAIEAAESRVQAALENREEDLESILLNAITQYWNAFVLQRQLQENIAAREKYEQLVRNVRRKTNFNLATPGELPRLLAEMEAAESRVKASSAAYLNGVEQLFITLQIETPADVEFVIPEELPPVPRLAERPIEELRVARVARLALENAERDLNYAKVAGLPRLDLVGSATTTGVDPDGARASSEMVSGTRPTYFVGLELETALDSSLLRGELADRRVAVEQARNSLGIALDNARLILHALERTVVSNYAIAKARSEAVEHRQRVVRELEISYRQGRQPLVELIRSYNELFLAQQEKARAIGDYHTSLNQLAAARDELVTVKK